ncbi:MAG: hypothetical protein IT168_28160 [Bryobacterales bacterium]|nr:hypothetical protein [Bryobacterales bacterium]
MSHPSVSELLQNAQRVPDYFNTRPGAELLAVLRHVPGRPIDELLNTDSARFDLAAGRIFRDIFWKGSFAADTLLGWEERLREWIGGSRPQDVGSLVAGGSFWKRFDRLENGVAYGHVVNYELHQLPGKPEVRTVDYPNDGHKTFRQGDPVLLLNYTNVPYRLVYDVIKIVDDNNAIGIMHLGEFPNGFVFAPFAMARHNYPLKQMSVEDHRVLFDRGDVRTPAKLSGHYSGYVVDQANPHISAGTALIPKKVEVTLRGSHASIKRDGNDIETAVDADAFRELPDRTLIAHIAQAGAALRLVLSPAG